MQWPEYNIMVNHQMKSEDSIEPLYVQTSAYLIIMHISTTVSYTNMFHTWYTRKSLIMHGRWITVVLVLDHIQASPPQVLNAVVNTDVPIAITNSLLLAKRRFVLCVLALGTPLSLRFKHH